ncbi:DUF4386 domain-containing protein [Spirosoma daeguense]
MHSESVNTRLIGILFLIPLLAYGFGSGLVLSVIETPNYLTNFPIYKTQLIIGAMLVLINSISVVTVGILLFPVLEATSKALAISYLMTRFAEALLLVVGLASLVSLGVSGQPALFETTKAIVKNINFWTYQSAMLVLGIGSTGFCYWLVESKVIPRLLSILGLIGYGLLALGAILEFFSCPVGIWLSIPGGLFEVGFGVWLIIRNTTFAQVSVTYV